MRSCREVRGRLLQVAATSMEVVAGVEWVGVVTGALPSELLTC